MHKEDSILQFCKQHSMKTVLNQDAAVIQSIPCMVYTSHIC